MLARKTWLLLLALVFHSGFAAAIPNAYPQEGSDENSLTLLHQFAELTAFGATANDSPTASQDGNWIAYTTKASGIHPVSIGSGSKGRVDQFIPYGTRLMLGQTHGGKPLDIAQNLDAAWLPSWAPDSTRLAFLGATDGHVHLWLYDVVRRSSRRIADVDIAPDLNDYSPPAWSRSGSKLYVSTFRALDHARTSQGTSPEAESPGTAGLVGGATLKIYRSGQESTQSNQESITQNLCNIFSPTWLVEVDAQTGDYRTLDFAGDFHAGYGLASPSGKSVMYVSTPCFRETQKISRHEPPIIGNLVVVSLQDRRVVFSEAGIDYPNQLPSSVPTWIDDDQLIYSRSGEVHVVASHGAGYKASSVLHQHFKIEQVEISRKDHGLLVTGYRPESAYPDELVAMWLSLDGQFTAQALRLPDGFQLHRILASRDHVLWQPTVHHAVLVGSAAVPDGGEPNTQFINIDIRSGASQISTQGVAHLDVVDTVRDTGTMIAVRQTPSDPPDIWEFSRRLEPVRQLSDVNQSLKISTVGRIRRFQTLIHGWDGQMIPAAATVILPKEARDSSHLPAVITQYPDERKSEAGVMFASDDQAGVPTAVLLQLGYAVVYSDLPTRPLHSVGDRAREATDTLLQILNHAASGGDIDLERLALFGWSQGAYTAAAIVSKTHTFRAAIVGGAAAYDLPGAYGYIEEGGSVPNRWAELGLNAGGPPWDHLKRYIDNSPYYQAKTIQTPLLLMIGSQDTPSYVVEELKMFSALLTYNKTAQAVIYDGEGHGVFEGRTANRIDASLRMLAFLHRYLVTVK